MSSWARALLSLTLSVGLLTGCLTGCGGSDTTGGLPQVDLQPVSDGAPVALNDLTTPAVINLWATWCGPCKAELPILEEQYERVGDKVTFAGVNIGDDPSAIAAFTRDAGVTYPQYVDVDGQISAAFGIASVPATLLVNPDGSYTVINGVIDADELTTWLGEVTGQP